MPPSDAISISNTMGLSAAARDEVFVCRMMNSRRLLVCFTRQRKSLPIFTGYCLVHQVRQTWKQSALFSRMPASKASPCVSRDRIGRFARRRSSRKSNIQSMVRMSFFSCFHLLHQHRIRSAPLGQAKDRANTKTSCNKRIHGPSLCRMPTLPRTRTCNSNRSRLLRFRRRSVNSRPLYGSSRKKQMCRIERQLRCRKTSKRSKNPSRKRWTELCVIKLRTSWPAWRICSRDSRHKTRHGTTAERAKIPSNDDMEDLFTPGFCRVYPPHQGRQDPDRIFRAAKSQAGQYTRQEQWGFCPCLDFTLWRRDFIGEPCFSPNHGPNSGLVLQHLFDGQDDICHWHQDPGLFQHLPPSSDGGSSGHSRVTHYSGVMKLGEKRRLQASHLLSFNPSLKKGDSLNQFGLHIRGSVNDVGFLYGAGAPVFTDVHGMVRAIVSDGKMIFRNRTMLFSKNLLHGAGAHISMDSFFAFCFSMWMIDKIFQMVSHDLLSDMGTPLRKNPGGFGRCCLLLLCWVPLLDMTFTSMRKLSTMPLFVMGNPLEICRRILCPFALAIGSHSSVHGYRGTNAAGWVKHQIQGPAEQVEFFHHTTVNVTKLRTSIDDIFTLWKQFPGAISIAETSANLHCVQHTKKSADKLNLNFLGRNLKNGGSLGLASSASGFKHNFLFRGS